MGEIKRISHRFPMQTEKSNPEGKRIMLEMGFTEFPALSVDPKVGISLPASERMFDYFSSDAHREIQIRG